MSIKSFFKELLNPTQEEISINEAKDLISKLMNRFSIEEQSSILLEVKEEIIAERKNQIQDVEKLVERLKADLEKVEKQVEFKLD